MNSDNRPNQLPNEKPRREYRIPRFAVYGGSFDPVHRGHLAIAEKVTEMFELDEFIFIPAFHAPHKKRLEPTSAYDRYAMLCLATNSEPNISVSKMEIEAPERPYTLETLERLKEQLPESRLFFVLGADSWRDITTWREWERVLTMTDQIVVTRPRFEISTGHVTEELRDRIVDVRGETTIQMPENDDAPRIYFTDIVNVDISATQVRQKIRENRPGWRDDLTPEVANYVEKYQIYR
ncbi:MAG: nicotinate-nucleotide adenylyltransferase [Pyrinomonadaceae bacterium]